MSSTLQYVHLHHVARGLDLVEQNGVPEDVLISHWRGLADEGAYTISVCCRTPRTTNR